MGTGKNGNGAARTAVHAPGCGGSEVRGRAGLSAQLGLGTKDSRAIICAWLGLLWWLGRRCASRAAQKTGKCRRLARKSKRADAWLGVCIPPQASSAVSWGTTAVRSRHVKGVCMEGCTQQLE